MLCNKSARQLLKEAVGKRQGDKPRWFRTWEIPAIENGNNLCGFQLQSSFRHIGAFVISDSRRYFTLTALERTWGPQRHRASSVYQIQETVSWKLNVSDMDAVENGGHTFVEAGAETLEDRARVHNVYLL